MSKATIFINLAVEDEAKSRAKKLGVDYSELLQRYEIHPRMLGASKGIYTSSAKKNGWDGEARIGIIAEDKFQRYCMAFMLKESDWVIAEPPVGKETAPESAPREEGGAGSEELLLTIEALTRSLSANTIQLTNLREQMRKEQKEAAPVGQSDKATIAVENIESALKTTNRALDAIDNKLNVIVSSMNRVETKLDKGNNATLDAANKLKAVVEATSGILNKIVKISAVLDRPRAK